MQAVPYTVAVRTPDHIGAGLGSRQRKSPTGGVAYGMPLNEKILSTSPPKTSPAWVFTVEPLGDGTAEAIAVIDATRDGGTVFGADTGDTTVAARIIVLASAITRARIIFMAQNSRCRFTRESTENECRRK